MTTERKSIRQRADDLERKLLGRPTYGGVQPGTPPKVVNPNELVTPPQYAALWAQTEAFLVDSFVAMVPRWMESFMLGPCKVTMSMVTGAPGCVTATNSLSMQFTKRIQGSPGSGGPPARREAKEYCQKAGEKLIRNFENWMSGLAPMGLNWFPAYSAPLPVYPEGVPSIPCSLAELDRTHSTLLDRSQLVMQLTGTGDQNWITLYDNLLQPGEKNLATQVVDSVAEQLSKYMRGVLSDSQVSGITAKSTSPTLPPPAPPMPFSGLTDTASGIVKVIENWRPEWERVS